MKQNKPFTKSKKAMSQFEVIGYAILAIVVIVICIAIFIKSSGAPSKSLEDIGKNTGVDDCKANPATCVPFQPKATVAPITVHDVTNIDIFDFKNSNSL